MAMGRATKRARDLDRYTLGTANYKPILATCQYIVEFADRGEAELAAHITALNMYAQCELDGNQYGLLDSIIDFIRPTTALYHADQKTARKGRTHYRRLTAGWKLFCQWKDGSISWTKLLDIKESHPIETDDYAIDQLIDDEPAFNW